MPSISAKYLNVFSENSRVGEGAVSSGPAGTGDGAGDVCAGFALEDIGVGDDGTEAISRVEPLSVDPSVDFDFSPQPVSQARLHATASSVVEQNNFERVISFGPSPIKFNLTEPRHNIPVSICSAASHSWIMR
jgi:hypothetical protein